MSEDGERRSFQAGEPAYGQDGQEVCQAASHSPSATLRKKAAERVEVRGAARVRLPLRHLAAQGCASQAQVSKPANQSSPAGVSPQPNPARRAATSSTWLGGQISPGTKSTRAFRKASDTAGYGARWAGLSREAPGPVRRCKPAPGADRALPRAEWGIPHAAASQSGRGSQSGHASPISTLPRLRRSALMDAGVPAGGSDR